MNKVMLVLMLVTLINCKNESTNQQLQKNINDEESLERKQLNDLSEHYLQLINEEKYAAAIPIITKCITIQKNANNERYNSFSYFQRGRCKYYLGDYNSAIEDLKKAEKISELEPVGTDPNTYVYLAKTYLRLNNFDEACRYLRLSGESGNSGAYDLITKHCN